MEEQSEWHSIKDSIVIVNVLDLVSGDAESDDGGEVEGDVKEAVPEQDMEQISEESQQTSVRWTFLWLDNVHFIIAVSFILLCIAELIGALLQQHYHSYIF